MTATSPEALERFGLKPHTISAIQRVFARHPRVERAVLYGSRAKGNFRPGSDIDLTLFGESLTYADLCRIETEIDDLLLPYTLDLSLYAQFENADLREHIRRVGLVFYPS